MLAIAVCDDETIVVANIEKMLEDIASNVGVNMDIDVFYDGSTLIEHVNRGNRYDIIYLDIEMAKKNGVDTAKEIRMTDINVLIIYVTNHESFAKEVFEVSAFRFITKPIDFRIFSKYFIDAIRKIMHHPEYFQYQFNKISYRIPIHRILYFQSDKRITYIVTDTGDEKCYEKLNKIEKRLVESGIYFYRTHQSFLVNPQYVSVYSYDSMRLLDGTTLTVSEKRRKIVNELFCKLKGEDIIV